MKKLYHLSKDIRTLDSFGPRVPDSRMTGEDSTISRICVSDSIEHCMSALSCSSEPAELYRVYEFDVDDIPEDSIISYKELYEKSLVADAMITREYWILEEVPYFDTYLISIDRTFQNLELVVPFSEIDSYNEYSRMDDEYENWEEDFIENSKGYYTVTYPKVEYTVVDLTIKDTDKYPLLTNQELAINALINLEDDSSSPGSIDWDIFKEIHNLVKSEKDCTGYELLTVALGFEFNDGCGNLDLDSFNKYITDNC